MVAVGADQKPSGQLPVLTPIVAAPPVQVDSLPIEIAPITTPIRDTISATPISTTATEKSTPDTLTAAPLSAPNIKIIKQLSTRVTGGQYEAVYLVADGDQTDTVDIQIPLAKEEPGPLYRPDTLIKNNCVQTAPEFEVDKLRVRMMEADKDSDKIAAMKKWSQKYCLLVKQVKALSELFSSDEQKLTFYTAVYPYTFDPEQFGQLQSTLQETSSRQQFAQQFMDPK